MMCDGDGVRVRDATAVRAVLESLGKKQARKMTALRRSAHTMRSSWPEFFLRRPDGPRGLSPLGACRPSGRALAPVS
jgi:hypothetical protein